MLCLPSHNPNNERPEILTESLPTIPLPLHPLHIHGQCTHTLCALLVHVDLEVNIL